MTNRFLFISIALGCWLVLTVFIAQSQLSYSLFMVLAGVVASSLAIKREFLLKLRAIQTQVDREATGTGASISQVLDSIHASAIRVNRKIELSIDGINHLGNQGELGELDALLKNDPLGQALSNAGNTISKIKIEESRRKWIIEGLAKFGELLTHKTELREYGNVIISSLVKYIGANQGGLFLEKRDELDNRYMELTACYAYERRKYLEGKIEVGQGLLGQCMLEKDFMFITDVPKDYVRITSGLGYATPRQIAIAPLIVRDVFYGAVELGLFEVMQPHAVEFFKKVCENIASEIASIRNLEETRQLLAESNTLASELQDREQEMKQNLEELAATQEEMARKQLEIDSYLAAINITIASAEFSPQGIFIKGNDIFLKVLGYSNDELRTRNYLELMPEVDAAHLMWDNIRIGKFFSGEFKMKDQKGNETWLTGTFNPVVSPDGKIIKVMMLAQFVTQEKEHLNELTEMANILKTTLPLAEFNDQFVCKTANDRFMKLFGVSRLQLRGKSMFDFIEDGVLKGAAMREALVTGYFTATLPFKVNSEIVSFEVSISRSTRLDGKTTKFTLVLIKESDQKIQVLAAV